MTVINGHPFFFNSSNDFIRVLLDEIKNDLILILLLKILDFFWLNYTVAVIWQTNWIQRNWVFATNSHLQILILSEPNVGDLDISNYELCLLKLSKFEISKVRWDIEIRKFKFVSNTLFISKRINNFFISNFRKLLLISLK